MLLAMNEHIKATNYNMPRFVMRRLLPPAAFI